MADFDIAPRVVGNKIVTNAFTDEGPSAENNFVPYVSNVRVFDFGFDDVSTAPLFTQDPGFHPQPVGGEFPASGLTPASSIRIGVISGLSYFAGGSTVAFSAVPSTTSLSLHYGSNSIAISASGATTTLLNLGATDANGEFDNHLESSLTDSAATGNLPADGIYLFSLQVNEVGTGISASDPVYILFGVNAGEEDVDSAKLFVRDTFAPGTNLAPVVPEPAAMMSVLPLAGLMLRPRRH